MVNIRSNARQPNPGTQPHIVNLGEIKPGSYAISSVGAADWLNAPLVQQTYRPKKAKGPRCPLASVFLHCASLTEDPFWASVFEAAAAGKYPRYFSYANDSLVYKRGSRTTSVEIPRDPAEALEICLDFFRSNGGITSEAEREQALEESDEPEPVLTWNDIGKKHRGILLELFVEETAARLALNPEECRGLRHAINVGVSLGHFNGKNIIIEGRWISKIEGLVYHEAERKFSVSPSVAPRASRSSSKRKETDAEWRKDGPPSLALRWQKYVEDIERKAAKIAAVPVRRAPPPRPLAPDEISEDTPSRSADISDYS